MSSPYHHPDCPRCKGQGFYLRASGRGYMRDGSFEHNAWQDCDCYPHMDARYLPKPVETKERW